ncbi:CYTH domain-containing protein [Massilia sp. W12]|uniref:CYTH domain-containing protein n=1 Tax=Massilia sp. W12 TaxID=3126507 RepID=UPI0030D1B56D
MKQEIERKFLLQGEGWRELAKAPGATTLLRQGYLSTDPERVVRVRIEGDEAYLTIKGKNGGAQGLVRAEWEYPIPLDEAQDMLDALCSGVLEKRRSRILYRGFWWEVDEFLGANAPLVLAEIELDTPGQAFDKPEWIGAEVSQDMRYMNSNLARQPYSTWAKPA